MLQYRIARRPYTVTIIHGASANEIDTALTDALANGILKGVIFNTPATLDNAATAGIEIVDADGNSMFKKTAVAANTKNVYLVDANNQPLTIPLAGAHTVKVTTSAFQSITDATFTFVLLIDKLR